MFWFRIAINIALGVDLIWGVGLVAGILLMVTTGSQQQNMTTDPTMNSTLSSYVFILIFQFGLIGLCFFGFFNSYKVWRNNYMMDHTLRHFFIIWVCCWGICLLGMLAIAMYALIRGKDPQGQMGFMYEMFTKYAIDPRFVSNFERYQKDHSCCGLYGPDDWFIVQLRASPGGGGGGGMGGFFGGGGMDDGFQQNPSSGKCHIFQPLIPPGCGPMMMKDINQKLGMYAGLTIFQVFLGIVAAILAWYCFFYWLEKEVIVIPEDEVSNIVVIEPDDSFGSMDRRMSERPYQNPSAPPPYYGSNYIHHKRTGIHSIIQGTNHQHHTQESIQFGRPASEFPHHHQPTYLSLQPHHTHATTVGHTSDLPLPPAMLTPSVQHFLHSPTAPIPLHHNSFVENSFSVRTHRESTNQNPPLPQQHHHDHEQTKEAEEAAVDKQLKTLGGKVLVKMKVDHKLDENGGKNSGEEESKVKKPKKATLAIVRNQHKHDPPPDPPPAHHGHTGNLAQDIAAMTGGGKKTKNKIEDLVISDHPHQVSQGKPPEPEILGSVSGFGAGSALVNLLEKGAATKAKERELVKKKEKDEDVIQPVVIGTSVRLHGGGGSIIQEIAKKQEDKGGGGGGGTTEPHGTRTMKYLPITHHDNHRRGTLTLTSAADYQYHAQPPATLHNLAVPGTSTYHHHSGRDSVTYEPQGSIDFGSSRIRESLLNAGSSAGQYGQSSLVGHNHHHMGTASRLTNPAHDHRPSLFNPGHEHRASIYITPHHHPREGSERSNSFAHGNHRPSFSPSRPQYGHRPSIFIKPKREHSRLSRVIRHHQQRSRIEAAAASREYEPHTHFGSVIPEEDHHHHGPIGSLIAPVHEHDHHHFRGSLVDHHEHEHEHEHHAPHGSLIAPPTRNDLDIRDTDRHHHLDHDDRHHDHDDRHHDHDDRHHDHDHRHHDNDHDNPHRFDDEPGPSRRRRSEDPAYPSNRTRYIHATRPYLDGGSLNNNRRDSRYPSVDRRGTLRAHERRYEEDEDRGHRSMSPGSRYPPRRSLHEEDDDEEYGYQPPPRHDRQGSSSRSRSSGQRRRDEENARILYKNPRRLDDSD